MDTSKLKKFAQFARRTLGEQVSAKLALVLSESSAARRESAAAVTKLEQAIKDHSKEWVSERVAYIWFNRFCALRFMDANRYTRIGIVSPAEGQFQPEILLEAKMGHIDEEMVPVKTQQLIADLLAGKSPSHDPQGEAYRLLVVAACNAWHQSMPFLFERIDDYTELLMPDDLLSGNSILAYTREAMTPDACQDVEVIGWLYQFYISEKKDAVFEGLKKNQKITPDNIPAATQLFTPHWIVRYLVDNSLGRLWLLNRPSSKLAEQMAYYIPPEKPDADFLRINGPEDIKVCDPACGSGHMLTYAFDLLYAIYEEEGYDATEIPEKILTHNLYGIELDERAGELAAFALTMKARARQRRFFGKGIEPNICVLEKTLFSPEELNQYISAVGPELLTQGFRETLLQFTEADNFGSLIVPQIVCMADTVATLKSKNMGGDLFLTDTHQRVLSVLRMVDYLSPRYSVVIANPPYMGKKNMNGGLQSFLASNYSASSSDFYSAFIERSLSLSTSAGFTAMVTMDSWMFGDDYTEFRKSIFSEHEIRTLAHMGPHAFEEIKGEVVQVAAFVLGPKNSPSQPGVYFDLTALPSPELKSKALQAQRGRHVVFQDLFDELPRNVCAYFISGHTKDAFANGIPLKNISEAFTGLQTGDNNRFIKRWSEVSFASICFRRSPENGNQCRNEKWFPYVKGSEYRKWYGNQEFILDWMNDGEGIKTHKSSTVRNQQYYFRSGLAYNNIASKLSVRLVGSGFVFDQKNSMFFSDSSEDNRFAMSFLHSKIVLPLLRVVAPKDFGPGGMKLLPVIHGYRQFDNPRRIADEAVALAKEDWDSNESSWDFSSFPMLRPNYWRPRVGQCYQTLRDHWRKMALEMQRLEENNNRIFINAYGLQDELKPDVLQGEITLTCNPHYRYGSDKTEEELETLLLADTMRELASYAVGCMLGRYSLGKPGLILANQGETLADYLAQVPQPSFPADDDNVIPVLDGDWFADDITLRFRQFLRVAFGEEHYEDNLAFIEQALNVKGKRNYNLRDYFLSEFYADHVKRYKKRPIYWLFSSPKGSFNALIYMHRYRPDTVSVVLKYLRDYREKLVTEKDRRASVSINPATSQGDKTRALKEVDRLAKVLTELEDYERDVLYPLATEQIAIDLDDGVKVNYLKFGGALKKITGLDAKEED
ncbi:type II restriction endonuclease [Burkholderia diffusa]|uniref:site-specific DNA-methyltransferase (adenine-specific) n=1 Tax=Burkholderia diffusa TaxID=488732 RepID=A0AAW3PDK7_9BURK|nr:BREX-1 system adenine-specific DNA-methyltransferase PglX [Burkholderia diffusa]KWF31187.1 type II restriction endonuclease [Burkholderia diffusa]KWF35882.1 type II restriction endonuclease [Burkholderia diffusa]KWF45380.1 type II restriction endonuclease [Burkholderia diffusa]KWF50975.1 type II restriction endonuclease [Burkholderia diffusa]